MVQGTRQKGEWRMESRDEFPISSHLPCLLSIGRQCDTRFAEACPGRSREYRGNGISPDNRHSPSVPGASWARGGNQNTVGTRTLVLWNEGEEIARTCVSHDEDANAIFLLPLARVAWDWDREACSRFVEECRNACKSRELLGHPAGISEILGWNKSCARPRPWPPKPCSSAPNSSRCHLFGS